MTADPAPRTSPAPQDIPVPAVPDRLRKAARAGADLPGRAAMALPGTHPQGGHQNGTDALRGTLWPEARVHSTPAPPTSDARTSDARTSGPRTSPQDPDLPDGPATDGFALPAGAATLGEVFADRPTDGAPTGFVLARIDPSRGPILWIQDRMSRREAGLPHPPGLPEGTELLHLIVTRPVDVLWAMEQALTCRALAAVLGEVWGNPPAIDFTATKRLALRAEAHGVPAWLIRRGAKPDLSAARERWRVRSLPSDQHPFDPRAPGTALWQTELFRARFRAPGTWVARHDRAANRIEFLHGAPAAVLRDQPADRPAPG